MRRHGGERRVDGFYWTAVERMTKPVGMAEVEVADRIEALATALVMSSAVNGPIVVYAAAARMQRTEAASMCRVAFDVMMLISASERDVMRIGVEVDATSVVIHCSGTETGGARGDLERSPEFRRIRRMSRALGGDAHDASDDRGRGMAVCFGRDGRRR
ncbi:hypothetical protein [Sphingomonas sp. LB2R24]|uniref:hypothetical protein n=1 Tax=Sphingomonas sorbitolis TaxID=3096165 RepID=UPI002FCA647A